MSDTRSRFEEWASESGINLNLTRYKPGATPSNPKLAGLYVHVSTGQAWEAWQAAESQAVQRIINAATSDAQSAKEELLVALREARAPLAIDACSFSTYRPLVAKIDALINKHGA